MPDVHVKGLDEPIFFPDTMKPEEIQAALRKKFPPQAQPAAPQEELNYDVYRPEPSMLSKALDWAPAATRVGSSFLGSTPVVGGIFGAAGEALAQAEEKALQHRDVYDPKAITAQGLVGLIPGGAAGKLGWQMLKGGAKGLTAVTVPAVIERQQLPTKEELMGGAAIGAILPVGMKGYQTWKARGAGKEMSAYLSKKLEMTVGDNDHDRIAGLALLREQELTDVAKKEAQARFLGTMQNRQGMPDVQQAAGLTNQLGTEVRPLPQELTAAQTLLREDSAPLLSNVQQAWTRAGTPEAPPYGGRLDIVGQALGQQRWQGGEMLPPFREMLPPPASPAAAPTATSSLLQAAGQTLRPSVPEAPPASPTSSLLQMAQRTLTGETGSTNLFGDWARRIVGGGEPDALKNVPFVDLAVQHARAQAEGNVELATKLQQALTSRVPSAVIGKQIEKWFDVKTAAKVMRNPGLSALTEDNEFAKVNMWTNAAVQQTAAIAKSPGMKLDDRVSRQVAFAFLNHDIEPDDAMKVMMEKGLSLNEFISDVLLETSRSGRILQRMSHLRKSLNALTVDSPQAQDALAELQKLNPGTTAEQIRDQARNAMIATGGAATKWEKGGWWGRNLIDEWRGGMVLQPKTTMRNVRSQLLSSGTEMMDMAFMGNFRGAANLAVMEKRYFVDGLTHASRFMQGLPGKADELDKIFAAFPLQGKQILNTPSGEATMGSGYIPLLKTLAQTQEQFFRRAAFSSHIKTWAERNGTDLATALNNPQMVPQNVVDDGTRLAMRMTFSAQPESELGRNILNVFHQVPVLYALAPYPRYQANAMRYLWEHAPLGLSVVPRMMSSRAKLASGFTGHIASDREIYAQAMTGTVMFASAIALRSSGLAGEHWYTVKHEDGSEQDVRTPQTNLQREDLRAYAPFSGYLWGAELAKNLALYGEPRMNDQDLKAGMQAMMLRGGAGYSLADLYFGNDPVNSLDKAVYTIGGNILGGFTVPLRPLKDFLSGAEFALTGTSEEAKYRDVRQNPLVGPMLQNIPYASRLLPESPNPLVPGEAYQSDYPLMGQFTGSALSDITPVEAKVAELGLSNKTISAHSGNEYYDREVSRRMAGPASRAVWNTMQNPNFQRSSRDYQAAWLNEEIDRRRGIAGQRVAPPGSPLWREMQLERTPGTRRQIHRQRALQRQAREALE